MKTSLSNAWMMNAVAHDVTRQAANEAAQDLESADTLPAPESKPVPKALPLAMPSKRPFPTVRSVKRGSSDLEWEPAAMPLFACVPDADGSTEGAPYVRAGEAYAICRPGHERWPLGIASDHYRVTSHVALDRALLAACGETIRPNGIVMSGHGYHVAYGYFVRHMLANRITLVGRTGDHVIESKLVVSHDHTGSGALRAAMVLYLDGDALGAIVTSRALHVAAQPEIWQSNIDAMIERAIIAQDAIADFLKNAQAHTLTDDDRKFLKSRMTVRDEATTALDALLAFHRGYTKRVSWGVWERRMSDEGIRTLAKLIKVDVDELLRNAKLSSQPKKD